MGYTVQTDWQSKQEGCTCKIHRYHVAHLCSCGRLISHSQGDWDSHKHHTAMIDVDPTWYRHGDTSDDTFGRLNAYGLLPYFDPNYTDVYIGFADRQF